MKIGLAIETFDPHRGGAEQWTFQFAQQLLAEGHEVHVVARTLSGPGCQLPVVAHKLKNANSRLGFAAAAEKKLRKLKLDVVHDMGGGWYCHLFESHDGSRLAQWEQKLLRLPFWARPVKRMMIRVLPRYRNFRRLFTRQLNDRRHLVLALSKMVAQDYQDYHGVLPEQIRLIYNGVDTRRFSPDNRDAHREKTRRKLAVGSHEVLFLFVGHDFRRKGLATVLRAVGRLCAEGHPVRLLVVGGRRRWRYKRLARRYRASEAVKFLGPINDPVPYYAAADACVLPTFYDSFNLGVLEAASSGLPCVTTRCCGASELITHGGDGYLLSDPTDDVQLAQYMQELLDPQLRRRMGEAGRKLALRHTLQNNCRQIIDVYREITAQQHPAA